MTTSARSQGSPARRLEQSPKASEQLEVRVTEDPHEIAAAQRLRYRVFYEEMGAKPSPEVAAERRDWDAFDAHCEHLVIIDHGAGPPEGEVVGTYRLLRRTGAARVGGF